MPSGITVEKDCFIIFEKQKRRNVSTQQRGIALLMIGRDASVAAHPYKTKNKHQAYVPLPHHPKKRGTGSLRLLLGERSDYN